MKKRIISLLLFCGLASMAYADDLQLQDNHPDRYTVVKGDTLWAISGKFLKDPWRWPEIWKMNRDQIKNPHWIYPGDVVVLDTSGTQPELRLLRETVTLEPKTVIEPLEKAPIPTISPAVIGPFLSQPLLVEVNQFAEAPTIVGEPEGRLILGSEYQAYVSAIDESDRLNWQIFRPGNTLIDPETKQVMGHEAVYLGDAKVLRFGEPATIYITRSKMEINIGDKVIPTNDTLSNNFIPHAPDQLVMGSIMSAYGDGKEISRNSIVTLNRGSAEGLESGNVLAVYSIGTLVPNPKYHYDPKDHIPELNVDVSKDAEGKPVVNLRNEPEQEPRKFIQLPDERVGLVMVFRTFEHVSYALVMESLRPIHLNDLVRTP